MTTIAQLGPDDVVVGVDTHKDVHVAVALDHLGRRLGEIAVPTTARGYRNVLEWAENLGAVQAFGVEGTGSYGAGLARFLRSKDQLVLEVIRPSRAVRRRHGKSDPVDAEAAARAVLSGDALTAPKAGDDLVEMIRVLRVARASAMKSRTQAVNALKALLVTAPTELRDQLSGLSSIKLIRLAARLRPGQDRTTTWAAKTAMRALAVRYETLEDEIRALDLHLAELTAEAAPALVTAFGIGPDVAGALLVAAGGNPDRLHSEAAFAMLCGTSPVEASSGKVIRHRLNRSGDRQANAALYRVALVRLCHDPRTQAYAARRTAEGKSKAEIIRCLKRYIAREVYAILRPAHQHTLAAAA